MVLCHKQTHAKIENCLKFLFEFQTVFHFKLKIIRTIS